MVSGARRHCRTATRGLFGAMLLLCPTGAAALDWFGLFRSDRPPAVSEQALPYLLNFEAPGLDRHLLAALRDASGLHRARLDPPPDGDMLARRAASDLATLLDVLWGAARYNATVTIYVAGVPLRFDQPVPRAAADAAERFRAREPVPIRIAIDPGPEFEFRSVSVVDARTRRPFPPDVLPGRILQVAPGAPARATDIRAARVAIVDHFRGRSHPLARIVATEPRVYHRLQVMDLAITVDPGPEAPFGTISITGDTDVDPAVVRSHIYIKTGEPYSPAAVAAARRSILQLPAIGTVRMREAETLDAKGRLPITAEVADRPPRVLGLSARYSTLDGPAARVYWQHRNLFGGAESLRIEGDIFIPPRTTESFWHTVEGLRWSDIGGRVRGSFVKPALQGTRNDLLLDMSLERDRIGGDRHGGYATRNIRASTAIRHRFSDAFSAQWGLTGEMGETSDTLGTVQYRLIGLPATLNYDGTDRALDPTRGTRVVASVTPYPTFLGSSVGFVEARTRASAYHALDEAARIILAGRLSVGSISGATLAAIPANHRYYAGGGSSIRGYRFRSLSPLGPTGEVVGGRSLFEVSLEARLQLTETIGLVPFVDAGGAFLSSYPDFKEPLRYAAGLGLRYYTAVGPIRVDVAIPLNRRPGDNNFALYFGIGQAF